MARIIGLDYGRKRTGIAVTDPMQIIVSGLDTVTTINLRTFLNDYLANNEVEKIVIGLPTHRDGSFTYLKNDIDQLVVFLSKKYPKLAIDFQDESYSSSEAKEKIILAGVKKSKRRDKGLVDKVSAVLILQKYLKHI